MSKAWLPRLLDEGTIPALALAFAVGQSPLDGRHPQGGFFQAQPQTVDLTAQAPRVRLRATVGGAYAPTPVGSLAASRPSGKGPASNP
jgi:hypothetical protein